MRLRGPIRAPGDLPGRRPLASPTCSPGSRCRAATPAPEPAEKFRRCKREKSQLGRTPAPTQSAAPPPQPDPWRRRPWPPRTLPRAEGGVLHCGLPGGHRRRLGAVATRPGVLDPQVGTPSPAARPPCRPRRRAPRPARAPHLPRRAGPGLGQGARVTSGWKRLSGPPGRLSRGDGGDGRWSLSPPNSRRLLAPPALLPPSPHSLLLSCLSALFSGLITFRIKAKPSPGCEYKAPPSPPGEERGAGAAGGRGRGRGPRGGGEPGGGPQGWVPGSPPQPSPSPAGGGRAGGTRAGKPAWRREALPRTPGSRCPSGKGAPG